MASASKKDLLVKVISVQNAEIPHKKIISMLNIPKKSKINDFKTSDVGVIVWPFYEFEGKFITTIIVENIKKKIAIKNCLRCLNLSIRFTRRS